MLCLVTEKMGEISSRRLCLPLIFLGERPERFCALISECLQPDSFVSNSVELRTCLAELNIK